ncbi:F-box protein At2g26160-like [Abrus precatorius]|uniref:F-box protein At2g26160-like n=1 Tax=Abrus precatorius TaxID=3816 RepID=A0A8B8KKI7_ABRPR|nr:F-box protein At2g26160-like [Abrus precatorius]
MESSTPKWSNLPNDLVEHIVKLFHSPIDLLLFRSVCSTWRSSSSLSNNIFHSPLFPLKLPTPTCIDPDLRPSSILLTQSTIYKISKPSKTMNTRSWLVRVEKLSTCAGKVCLKDPLSPSLFGSFTNHKFPKVWNLLNLRVSEVSKAYELKFDGHQSWACSTSMFKKVVASDMRDNLSVIALHRRGKLGVCRVSEKKWTQIKDNQVWNKYIDITYHNNKFYAVDVKGLCLSVDCSQSQKVRYNAPPGTRSEFQYYDDRGRYLVNSLGNLLLVDNPPVRGCNVHFNVYRLNEDEGQWIPVDNLGDQALFLGDDCSFSVSAGDLVGCKSNCIYFTVYGYTCYDAYAGYHAWQFDLDDHTLTPLSPKTRFTNPFRPLSTLLKARKKSLALFLGC